MFHVIFLLLLVLLSYGIAAHPCSHNNYALIAMYTGITMEETFGTYAYIHVHDSMPMIVAFVLLQHYHYKVISDNLYWHSLQDF